MSSIDATEGCPPLAVSACLSLALGAASLLAAGCAAPRRVLVNPGNLYLTHGVDYAIGGSGYRVEIR